MIRVVTSWTRSLCMLLAALSMLVLGSSVMVAAIARGYTTDDQGLQTGMVVSLTVGGPSGKVERATQESSNRVVGVVTTVDNSLVTVSSGTANVLVESEGQAEAYVSDLAGPVAQGDLLVLSPLKGILMKSNSSPAAVIGIAAEDVLTTTPYSYQEVTQTKETRIAKVKINLNHQGGNTGATQADSALARLGRSLVGRDVGETRVLIALIIFVIVLIAEGGILYGAISSAIAALGRNPLARKAIRGELLRVMAVAIVVLLLGLAAIYAVLWV